MSNSRIDISGKGPIQFEGATLPESAKHFDAASFCSSLADDIYDWLLDLRYAWGRERRAASSLVLRACDEIEARIYSEREVLFAHLRDVYPQNDPAEICQEWLTAIQLMRERAETRSTCTWTVQPADGEVAYWVTQTIGLIRAMEKGSREPTALLPGFVEYIQSAPEEEQLRFIIGVTDSLSGVRD